jgi:hypothetical protein
MTDPNKNGRKKCDNRQGRPCHAGRKGGKNARGGCDNKQGRPCGSKNKKGKKK